MCLDLKLNNLLNMILTNKILKYKKSKKHKLQFKYKN